MFIKECVKEMLITQKCSLEAEKAKIKSLAKEKEKLSEEEENFYYTQMTQITKALIECKKQLKELEAPNAKNKDEK